MSTIWQDFGAQMNVPINRDQSGLGETDSRYIITAKQEVTGFEIVADRDELAVIAGIVKDMGLSRGIGLRTRFRSYYHRMQAAFWRAWLASQTQFVRRLYD